MSSATSTSPGTDRLLNRRYRIEERIARGGMATVHRGHDERLDRVVALKIMHPHLALDDQFRRRFAREARAAARLAHRNVVGVFDQGEDGENIYLAMELIDGETLRTRIHHCGCLTIAETLDVTAQTLEALAAAHEAGIVHRDIKPENILIDGSGTVKVADFGLARAIGTSNSSTSATLLGTVAYISPEVVTRGHCDERSDLYSLGVVIHEMLTGAQPFTGEQPVHIAFQHVHEDIPAPSASADGIPPGLDSLVTWACARRPEQRPRSARELLAAVRELRDALPAEVLAARPVPREPEASTGEMPSVTAAIEEGLPEHTASVSAWGAPDEAPLSADATTSVPSSSGDDPSPQADVDRPAFLTGRPDDAGTPDDDPATTERIIRLRQARARQGRHRDLRSTRRSPVVGLLALTAATAALIAGGWYGTTWYLYDGPGADRTVPVLVGTGLQDAETALSAADLGTRTREEFSDTVPAGHVITVSPASGSTVKRGTDVQVVVSKGQETFPVPDLAGTTLQEAKSAVEGLGLVLVEDPPEHSETVPKGSVISQSQAADSLPAGGEVHVVLSQGRQPITVPDQRGQDGNRAAQALRDAGLTVSVSRAHSGTVAAGLVASQDPAGGTLFRGDRVRLVISQGPEMVAVPDVFGAKEADARAKLESAGFKVAVVYKEGRPVLGQVFAQSQQAGTKAPKGSMITLSVF